MGENMGYLHFFLFLHFKSPSGLSKLLTFGYKLKISSAEVYLRYFIPEITTTCTSKSILLTDVSKYPTCHLHLSEKRE